MKIVFIEILKFFLRLIYLPIKALNKPKDRVLYLSRQSNEKSLDMQLLEQAIEMQAPGTEQVFRLKMMEDGLRDKMKYCFHILGDMQAIASSRVVILDTYSIAVSCLKHHPQVRVIQMWHALGTVKKFGLQALDTKEGRDAKVSRAMRMHKHYDYVLAPSAATAKFYMEAFGCGAEQIKICSLPRVDRILTPQEGLAQSFFSQNPGLGDKKIVLYLPTFRDREAYVAEELKTAFSDETLYQLIIRTHPLSKVKKDEQYTANGDFSTYDLMQMADIIITDYSACAFEAGLLMKPLYFFVPDYSLYLKERGLNVDLKAEMPEFVFEDAQQLVDAVKTKAYDYDSLYAFKSKYVENIKNNNAEILAKFVLALSKEQKK